MAKENAKKNWRKNAARMRIFSLITLAVNVLYTAFIMYRNGNLPHFSDLLAIAFWAGQEYFALAVLKRFAQPVFNSQGELLECPDASDPAELGFYTLAQDILWVCWVVQTLCIGHGAFIVFYLPVPATIMYKGYNTVLKPLLMSRFGGGGGGAGGAGAEDDGNDRQPRNRQERRREERQQRKTRKA